MCFYRGGRLDAMRREYEQMLRESMAKSVNSVTLIGNVGRDVEYSSPGGLPAARMNVCTNEREKVNGEWQDVAEWHNVVLFGKLADVAREYTSKGSKIYICGRLKTRSWEKDGVKKYRTEIIASEVVLLGDPGGHKRYAEDEYSQRAPGEAF